MLRRSAVRQGFPYLVLIFGVREGVVDGEQRRCTASSVFHHSAFHLSVPVPLAETRRR